MIKSLLRLGAAFLKVGVIGFGGGSALIPVIHNELVARAELMSDDDYLKHTVVANITPGALPVKLGATCGAQMTNAAGSVLAACLVALPGVLATVLLIAFFAHMGPEAINLLNYASLGITVFIIYLLLHYVAKTTRAGDFRTNAGLCALAFLLTGGRELREIAESVLGLTPHALGRPLFDLSMISVMFLSFFCIAWFLLADGRRRLSVTGAVLAAAYALLSGSAARGRETAEFARQGAVAVMIAGVAVMAIRRAGKGGRRAIRLNASLARAAGAFVVLPCVFFALCLLLGVLEVRDGMFGFLGNIVLSSVTSFGGGEAYVAVADSIFVQTGHCEADVFYGRIVPVANALPGPILVKIAAAIGFVRGSAWGGTVSGLAMAGMCGMLAVGACCAVALAVLNYYDALRQSAFMLSLRRYILPVICGTLVSTSLAMLYESLKIAGEYGCPPRMTAPVMAAGVALTFFATSRKKINDLALLLFWMAASLAVMTLK